MKTTTRNLKRNRRRSGDAGSALLISLMVLVGLSLLGLAFVTLSETESAISVNERNAIQTQAIAEAGARAAVEWFQDPDWASSIGILPSNTTPPSGMKRTRVTSTYTGVYKPLSTDVLFDKPFRPAPSNRFYGDYDTADIIINDTIDATTITNLNTYLFGADSKVLGRIREVRVYAPPIIGGTLNANGFWEGGERFGTATIAAVADKWSSEADDAVLLSTQTVRVVVGEFPMPIPGGPIQTAAGAQFGGAFDVHWGMVTALANLDAGGQGYTGRSRIPWANPFERPHFERGYDSNTALPSPGPTWPILTTSGDDQNFFYEFVGKTFDDPWVGTRARGTNSECGACASYTYTSDEGNKVNSAFQGQTQTVYPTTKEVTFPTIRYDTWKRIAVQGRGTKGIYYFKYVHGTDPPMFKRNGQGTQHDAAYWVNTRAGAKLGAGFYFFDTDGEVDPQNLDGTTNTTVLTPGVDWQSNDFNHNFLMSGFIYLNMDRFRTTGAGNSAPDLPYNMPGEIYRDVGHRVWDTSTNAWALDAAGNVELEGAGDGDFSFQDLNGNGKFDVVVTNVGTITSHDPGNVNHTNQWIPKVWHVNDPANPGSNCTVPPTSGSPPSTACSEPHEPYLNFIYPDDRSDSIVVGWEDPDDVTMRPRDLIANVVPDCDTDPDECTSNSFDKDGALVTIPAILNGVLYNEGTYDSQGQPIYFGSVLAKGAATATGTPEVWFDEKLIKDDWAPPGMPRVIIYSSQTDE